MPDDLPEEGELVVATVQNVKNFGAFVTLDEYDGREGFIHIAEVASGWVKYIRDYIREGQKVVCKVIRVDREKGHIDLSLKNVNAHQKREKLQAWKDEQHANHLIEIALQKAGIDKDAWMTAWGSKLIDKYGSLYAALENMVEEEEGTLPEASKEKWFKEVLTVAKENIVPSKVTVEGYLMLTAPGKDGIIRIKNALAEVKRYRNLNISYLGAPYYRIIATGKDYKSAEETLKKGSNLVIKALVSNGGVAEFLRERK